MPQLSFEGETHDEIVQKVRRWLASVDGVDDEDLTPADVITQSAELTKDALRVVASAAPAGVGQTDLVKALTTMGYRVTDNTRDAALAGLDAIETATGGSVLDKMTEAGSSAVFAMNTQMAKQILKSLAKD